MITTEYKNEILSKVLLMKNGEEKEIGQGAEYSAKVEALKIITDWRLDIKHGFSLTFNNNFTKFRRDYYHA